MGRRLGWVGWPALLGAVTVLPAPAWAQVDQQRALAWFREAQALCERDGGRLWGVSLCGPMVFADPLTGTIATNQPAPAEDRPRALGFANTALTWGGTRWATYVWRFLPAEDSVGRRRVLMHELFHRVQPELRLITAQGRNDHLDTFEGRYWLRLEWRALAQALRASGPERDAALRDAAAFRLARRAAFPGAAENERLEEIREGLAQFTGTVVSAATAAEATASAVEQLARAESEPTFVRVFAYPLGAAYGILLDAWSPGWTRQVRDTSDLGNLLVAAAGIRPTENLADAASRYGGKELRAAEERRDIEQRARLAELRRRYVDGPVLVIPGGRGASFITTGATPLPGNGTVFLTYRVAAEWGSFETTGGVLVAGEGGVLTVPAPANVEGNPLAGDGWTVTLAPGWVVRPGPRAGDYRVVRLAPGNL